MNLLFAEDGVDVSIYDISEANIAKTYASAEAAGYVQRVHICQDYDTLCASLSSPRVFIFKFTDRSPGRSHR